MSENLSTDTSPPTFFSGWRPMLGWISIGAFSLQFVFFPLVEAASILWGRPVVMPKLDISSLIGLLTAVLGMGGLRTIEKLSDVHSN
jgi:hypothetical protein